MKLVIDDYWSLSGWLWCTTGSWCQIYCYLSSTAPQQLLLRIWCGLTNIYLFYPAYYLSNSIHHMDLYRLPDKFDSSILGIPDIFKSSKFMITMSFFFELFTSSLRA